MFRTEAIINIAGFWGETRKHFLEDAPQAKGIIKRQPILFFSLWGLTRLRGPKWDTSCFIQANFRAERPRDGRGNGREGKGREGKEREGEEREGEGRKVKERKGEEREGRGRRNLYLQSVQQLSESTVL